MFFNKYVVLMCFLLLGSLVVAQNKKAARYNDKIINEQHQLSGKMVSFLKSLRTSNAADLNKSRNDLITQIDASISRIQSMDGFEGDTKLRDGALDLFKFYKSTLEKDYPKIIELATKKNRSEIETQQLNNHKNELIGREDQMDAQFAAIQEEFAGKHKLTLTDHEIK